MKAMVDFMKALFSLPVPIRLWLGLLMVLNMLMPLLFIKTPEGIASLVAAMMGAVMMSEMHQRMGFVRLLGIGHIFWVPLVVWFWFRIELAPPGSLFLYWMWSMFIFCIMAWTSDRFDYSPDLPDEMK